MANSINSSNRRRKWIFLGIGLLTAGLSLFSYNYWKKNKGTATNNTKAPDIKATKPKTTTATKTAPKKAPVKKPVTKAAPKKAGPPPKSASAPKAATKTKQTQAKQQAKPFPLKSGDKNSFVKKFQEAIIKKHGKSILPKFGADGSFGNELAAAVRKIQKLSATSPATISESLYNSIVKSKVLTGVEPSLIITTLATKVWKDPRTAVSVPVNMVLGQQVCQRGNFTLFENDKQYFLVETKTIKLYAA